MSEPSKLALETANKIEHLLGHLKLGMQNVRETHVSIIQEALDTVVNSGHAPASRAWVSRAEHEQEIAKLDKEIEDLTSVIGKFMKGEEELEEANRKKDQRIAELEVCIEPGKASAIVNGIFQQARRLGFYKPTAKHALTQFVEHVEAQGQRIAELEGLLNCIPHTHDDVRYYGSKTMEEAKQICLACTWERLKARSSLDWRTKNLDTY